MPKIRVQISAAGDDQTRQQIIDILKRILPSGVRTRSKTYTNWVWVRVESQDFTVTGLQSWRDKYEKEILDELKSHNISSCFSNSWGSGWPFYALKFTDEFELDNL